MPGPKVSEIRRIALINFGGIGDELLFSPVIQELRTYLPHAQLTLLLEERSQAVVPLLPPLDAVVPLKLQGTPKPLFFFQLLQALVGKGFDAVISAGSSPFIPLLLSLTGIPHRVGFNANALSQKCLTVAAPLIKQQYAADMYFSLASSFLRHLLGDAYTAPASVLPVVQAPSEERRAWALDLIKEGNERHQKNILIHPGVSRVSLQKGIDKTWSPEQWAELIAQLTLQEHFVYMVGGPDDQEIVRAIEALLPLDLRSLLILSGGDESFAGFGQFIERITNLSEEASQAEIDRMEAALPSKFANYVLFTSLYGETKNLSDLAALIERADLLVSVDSSPLHIAVGLNKPVVALFGPTNEEKLLPERPYFKAVTRTDLTCRPCLWDVRAKNCETSDCLKVEPQAMMRAIQDVLAVSS